MTEIVSGTVAERRFLMTLLSAYAVVALGVAVAGIFGVVAYQVARRTGEFGVRLALGSSPSGLLRLVLTEVARLAVAGLVVGLCVHFAAGRLLAGQLYGLSAHDPGLLMVAGLALLAVCVAAGMAPALKVIRIAPSEALRHE